MDNSPQTRRRRLPASIVLLLGLAVTLMVWRHEHKLASELRAAQWHSAFGELDRTLDPLLSFQSLQDVARAGPLERDDSGQSWTNVLFASEWRQHFPALEEIGYVSPVPGTGEPKELRLKFFTRRNATNQEMAATPLDDLVVQHALHDWYNYSNGPAAIQLVVSVETNRGPYETEVFLTLRTHAGPGFNSVQTTPKPNGVLFLKYNQMEFFNAIQPKLAGLPIDLRLLARNEPDPPRTPLQKSFKIGDWHFLAILKLQPAMSTPPEWLVPVLGVVISLCLFWLFSNQARLRYDAESSRETVIAREAEILALNRDLEQKIAARTAELHEALAGEKEINRLKTNFTSMVTHEIRTPLEVILSSAEILLRYLDRLPVDKRVKHLHTIRAEVQRMSSLMQDVLLFSRAESGRMEFHPALLDLKVFCGQLVDEIQSATNQRCPVELRVAAGIEPARADENLLRHTFVNLLTNAVKYSSAGTPVTFAVSREGGNAIFVIQDSGMGISEDDRQRLFTPFYRGKNATTVPGTGLGLVIVKHCIERHGGTIEIQSTPAASTTVTVCLPLYSPAHTEFLQRRPKPTEPL